MTRTPSRPLKDVNTVAKELDSLTENHTAMLTSFIPYIFLDLILFSWFIVLFLGIFVLGFCYGILCNIFFIDNLMNYRDFLTYIYIYKYIHIYTYFNTFFATCQL